MGENYGKSQFLMVNPLNGNLMGKNYGKSQFLMVNPL